MWTCFSSVCPRTFLYIYWGLICIFIIITLLLLFWWFTVRISSLFFLVFVACPSSSFSSSLTNTFPNKPCQNQSVASDPSLVCLSMCKTCYRVLLSTYSIVLMCYCCFLSMYFFIYVVYLFSSWGRLRAYINIHGRLVLVAGMKLKNTSAIYCINIFRGVMRIIRNVPDSYQGFLKRS